MSVFNEFQKMWAQKFPDSSLSGAWEADIRASLDRHKERIVELQKELEQENLYCMYLEKLLSDVAKIREDGGDPASLLDLPGSGRSAEDEVSSGCVQYGCKWCILITPFWPFLFSFAEFLT